MQVLRAFLMRHAAAALMLALVAVAIRIAIPAGTMPVAGTGGISFILCSGAVDNQHAPVDAPYHHSDGPCPFASLGAAGTVPPAANNRIASPERAIALANPIVAAGFLIGDGLGRPPLPARAPPMGA